MIQIKLSKREGCTLLLPNITNLITYGFNALMNYWITLTTNKVYSKADCTLEHCSQRNTTLLLVVGGVVACCWWRCCFGLFFG